VKCEIGCVGRGVVAVITGRRQVVECGRRGVPVGFEDGRECWSWGQCWWRAMLPSEAGDRGGFAEFGWWLFVSLRLDA
jgi:hypothetical protein